MKKMGMATLAAGILGMSVAAQAAEVLTRVHAVQPGVSPREALSVLTTADGRIYSIPATERAAIARLQSAVHSGRPVHLALDAAEDSILTVSEATAQEARLYDDDYSAQADGTDEFQAKHLFDLADHYNPTITNTDAETEQLFQSLTTRTRGTSQCYQRASYWAHHMWRRQGTRSMKIFMFMTEAYRTLAPPRGKPQHRWWFHVAPMVYQRLADGTVQERVLDRGWPRTITHPQTIADWTTVFIDTGKQCRIIDSYQAVLDMQAEWRRDPRAVRYHARNAEHCLIRIAPMYYYQPLDLEALDLRGVQRSTWTRYALDNHHCAVDFCM